MKVTCPHCGSNAHIVSRNIQTSTAADLYCQCRNAPACGAIFVYTLAYRHTIHQPAPTAEAAAAVIRTLPASELARLAGMQLLPGPA